MQPGGPVPARPRRKVFPPTVALIVGVALLAFFTASASAASFTVNDTGDRIDRSIGNGICATTLGTCTVRAAVQESNALTGHDTIHIPSGVHELEIPVINDDLDETGDYDVHDSVTFAGEDTASSILDGGWPLDASNPEAKG